VQGKSRETLLWAGWPILAAAMAMFAFTCFIGALFNDGDTYWHLAAGQWIVDHWSVPHTDPFSFTARGRAWTAHEWLSEVIMAGAFAAGSWVALSILFAAAVAGTILVAGLHARLFMRPLHAVAAVILLFIFLEPSLLARPHALAWPLLAGWTILLLRARKAHCAPPLAATALILLWANMHASFIFGLVLAAFFAFEALVEEKDRKRVLFAWGPFVLVSLLLALANPSGRQGLLYPFQVSSMKALPVIQEWRPSTFSSDPLFFAVTALGVLLAVLMGARPSPLRLLLIALLFYLAVSHMRHQAVFGIVACLLVASSLQKREREDGPPFSLPIALIAGVVLITIGAIRYAVPDVHKEGPVYPSKALAALPPSLAREPVFNAYNLGGVLILKGIAPFIDGRADMYGDAFTASAYRIERGDARLFDAAVAKWGLRWAILHPDQGLVHVLDNNPEWRRLYSDRYAVVFARR
jgi:hypothetical protein